ncbi:flagellar hook-associated protein FlgK [Mycetocola miduiensis]|uniref:Flagellar hook-associated protein 1 n=1 Tax=Mycetocola miduiensis TaxID=995034 RepID=A0A1I4YXJ9_9MICO|nr:flagellar hook-associated protein FlgK [Mycetocola miduiensis]SFN42360.1 flagellar hook-associated protein 1 FlgK [Mycetocola miduiensis]
MSTFSGLNTAYTGLIAARQGLDVVGQNIANANTVGYTRQRVTTSAIGALGSVGPLATSTPRPGGGVSVDSIARLGNVYLDARVRSSAGLAGYSAVRANVLGDVESSLREPGENGLSAQLQEFWASWQGLSNSAGTSAAAGIVLEQAGVLVSQIERGYGEMDAQWSHARSELSGMAEELNSAAAQVANLNVSIRTTLAAGGSVNELVDQRNSLTTTIAALTGATVAERPDGTIDVLLAGNAIVSGDTVRPVSVVGSYRLDGAADAPVRLEWAHRPGSAVALAGGEIAGAVSVLAPSDATRTGGAIAEAAQSYNDLATALATQVNAIHRTGATATGTVGLDFFTISATGPAARGLSVVPQDASGIAAASPGAGGLDGSTADAISQIGTTAASPDAVWAGFVTRTGVIARTELQQAALAELAASSASNAQLANASVDLDEENVNLVMFQSAYQGAARVMTAVDEMLDTLINRTGIVGR